MRCRFSADDFSFVWLLDTLLSPKLCFIALDVRKLGRREQFRNSHFFFNLFGLYNSRVFGSGNCQRRCAARRKLETYRKTSKWPKRMIKGSRALSALGLLMTASSYRGLFLVTQIFNLECFKVYRADDSTYCSGAEDDHCDSHEKFHSFIRFYWVHFIKSSSKNENERAKFWR